MAGAFRYDGPSPMGLASYVQQQGQMGKQQGEDSRLARLVSGAMADPASRQSKLAEIASFRPEAAFQAQDQFDNQDDRKYAELGKRAAVLAGAPEAMRGQVWAQLRPELEQTFGMQGLPAEVTPEIIQTAQQLAQVYGGGGNGAVSARAAGFEQLTRGMTPDQIAEARRVELGLAPRAVAPGYSVQEYTLPDGSVGWRQIPTRGMAPGQSFEVGGPGAPAPAPAADPQNVQADLMVLSRLFGVQPSSLTRTPEKNAAVGGVPTSQHLDGTAGDFPVPEAQKPQFMAMARQLGYEAIDEGDHVHLELPSRGRPQLAPQGAGQTDADRAAAAAQKVRAEETARRQLGLEYAGPEAAAAADAARQKAEAEAGVKRESAARTKAPQINNVVRGISRIDAAMKALDAGLLTDSGPLDQYALRFTEEGQELDAAVGAIKNDLLALTRVPGVGSQSDLEQRIADLKYPQLGFHPEVNRRNLEQLRAFIRDIEESIGGGGQSAPPPEDDIDALLAEFGN